MRPPPKSPFNSVGIIDDMRVNTTGDEPHAFNRYQGRIIRSLATAFSRDEPLDFSEDFLYRAYPKRFPPMPS
jgi:hypothetical protein